MFKKRSLSEKELVDGCLRNDRLVQEAFYRQHFAAMRGLVLRYTSDEEEALEILNNGFLRAFKKMAQFQFQGSLEGWLRKIVFHAVADHFRSKKERIHFLELDDRDSKTDNGALPHFYEKDLLQIINLLPTANQEVFRLFAIEGFSHAEIGKMLGISEGTSKWHLSEARKKLKEILSNHQEFRNHAK